MLDNPLYLLTVGSYVDSSGVFHGSLLAPDAQITRMVEQFSDEKSMRGESDLVYNTQTNQVSASVSGSYGVSGLSKASFAASGYWGNATAENDVGTNIVFEYLVSGGFEVVSFNDLTPAMLMAALSKSPRDLLKKALDAYLAMQAALNGSALLDVLKSTGTPVADAVRPAYEAWSDATAEFRDNFGESLVVGVMWGGLGRSTMTITDTSSSGNWKYGAAAQFTYCTPTTAVQVQAAYDASGSADRSKITVSCHSDTCGLCAKDQVTAWDSALNQKAMDAVTAIKPLGISAPTVSATLPQPPDFVPPQAEDDVQEKTAKLGKADLSHAAKASAYDRFKTVYDKGRKPGDPAFYDRLDDFLSQAEKQAAAKPVRDLQAKVKQNDFSTLSLLPASPAARPAVAVRSQATVIAMADQPDTRQYVPIGIWTTNWAELFPWLATGFQNEIDDTGDLDPALKFRVMQQDLLTLSRLYRYAASYDFSEPIRTVNGGPAVDVSKSRCIQIADEFAAACVVDVHPTDYAAAAAATIHCLGDAARAIYERWDEVKFLREAELGCGVLDDGHRMPQVPTGAIAIDSPMYDNNAPLNTTQHFTPTVLPAVSAPNAASEFDPTRSNYSVFAGSVKVIPLILPDKSIIAIGPGGFLCDYVFITHNMEGSRQGLWRMVDDPGHSYFATSNFDHYTVQEGDHNLNYWFGPAFFDPDLQAKVLVSRPDPNGLPRRGFRLFPIPFSAANGKNITWLGQSFSTNIGADADLAAKLDALAKDLDASRAWSFSTDALPAGWSGDDPYLPNAVKKSYFGLGAQPKTNPF